MGFVRVDSAWETRAPAKLNLHFEVLARGADGYHEVETLMVPISLYDTLLFTPRPAGAISLACRWGAGTRQERPLPEGTGNLVVRAIELLRKRAGCEFGARIALLKRIPTEAGLGGGSADAAAALRVANQAWNLGWPLAKLLSLAAELGSDVPFFLQGGAALCHGRGERVHPIPGLPRLDVVVVRPSEGLSTAQVYAHCRPATQPQSAAPLVAAWRAGHSEKVARILHNRLEEPAIALYPGVKELKNALRRSGCLGQQMTGSGSACFGICRNAQHARGVVQRLRQGGWARVFAAHSVVG